MTRREFFRLLSRSGLLVAGGRMLGPLPALAEASTLAGGPVVAAAGDAGRARWGCAVNPIGPYLIEHPFPWPKPAAGAAGPQKFDLLEWDFGPGQKISSDVPLGHFSIEAKSSGGAVVYEVNRGEPASLLSTRFECMDDEWHTPRSWTVTQHPTLPEPGVTLTSVVQGSLQDGRLVLGRLPDRNVTLPVTTFAALAGSMPVLAHAAQSGSPFYALTESGALLGPLQARGAGPLPGADGKPLAHVAAIWGERVVPMHVIHDSDGALAQTGFLMSFVRSSLV
jgi:hypothetical protein